MKIAYLSPGGAIGGAEMCLLDLLASLRDDRPDIRPTVILGDDGLLRPAIESLGVACEVLPLPAGLARLGDAGSTGPGKFLRLTAGGVAAASASLRYARELASRLSQLGADLVQSNGMKMHLLGARAASAGVPVVWHLHDYTGTRLAMSRLLRLAARPGVEAVAVSKSVADDARHCFRGRLPVTVIYNAVDLERFHPGPTDPSALDRGLGLPEASEGTVRVGLVATFAAWKGHALFLEAAARVPRDRPARYYIVGGPIYRTAGSEVERSALEGLAARLRIDDRVGFPGHQDDPAWAIRGLDVVVHASTRPEPFGRVIVEGMAAGRAVIAMTEGGASELFRDGIEALGCPPRDPDALAARMIALIDEPDARARLGRAARQAATTRFDRRRLAAEWGPVYDRLVTRSGAVAGSPTKPIAGPRTSP